MWKRCGRRSTRRRRRKAKRTEPRRLQVSLPANGLNGIRTVIIVIFHRKSMTRTQHLVKHCCVTNPIWAHQTKPPDHGWTELSVAAQETTSISAEKRRWVRTGEGPMQCAVFPWLRTAELMNLWTADSYTKSSMALARQRQVSPQRPHLRRRAASINMTTVMTGASLQRSEDTNDLMAT